MRSIIVTLLPSILFAIIQLILTWSMMKTCSRFALKTYCVNSWVLFSVSADYPQFETSVPYHNFIVTWLSFISIVSDVRSPVVWPKIKLNQKCPNDTVPRATLYHYTEFNRSKMERRDQSNDEGYLGRRHSTHTQICPSLAT